MKKVLLFSALMLGIAFGASAQSPGYMGRRLFLKPEFSSTVALFNPTADNKGGEDPYNDKLRFGLSTRYGVQAGYVMSRKWVVAVEGSYMKTGMALLAYTPSLASSNGEDTHNLFYNLGGPELGLSFQSYTLRKGSLAPLGTYAAVRARVSFLKGELFEHKIQYDEGSALGHGPLNIDPRHTSLALGMEAGSHHIVADHILLGVSAEFNLAMGLSSSASASGNQSLFRDTATRRMLAHSFFFFKIGAGYLF